MCMKKMVNIKKLAICNESSLDSGEIGLLSKFMLGVDNPHLVLAVDGEPQILRAFRTILTEKQFKVTTAIADE